MVVEGLCWGSPAEGLAGSAVEGRGDGGEVAGGVLAQVSAFGEVLPLRSLLLGEFMNSCMAAMNAPEAIPTAMPR